MRLARLRYTVSVSGVVVVSVVVVVVVSAAFSCEQEANASALAQEKRRKVFFMTKVNKGEIWSWKQTTAAIRFSFLTVVKLNY
jgi:hypothetical protein